MEERIQELFPDQIVQLRDYHSFVNQPERVQISSQQDINDYDPTTLTSYFNFRVRLPRPALNVKSLQLARGSIPNAVVNIPDTETTFWYYALPVVATGRIFEDNAGVPGALAYTFDTQGNLYLPGGALAPNSQLYFDGSGNNVNTITGCLKINNLFYSYSIQDATALPPTNVEVYAPNNDLDYWIIYDTSSIPPPTSNYLRYIRLLPSVCPPDLLNDDDEQPIDYAINRLYDDYDDLLSDLINACLLDPLEDQPSNNQPGQFKFVKGDVSFSYDAKYKKFILTGNNQAQFTHYLPVASDDPLWIAAAETLAQRDRANTNFNYFGVQSVVQQYIPFRNLNLRLGFTYATYPSAPEDYNNMIRPHPSLGASQFTTTPYSYWAHLAPGFTDLVYSSCCYIYTDITGGSVCDSIANKALLGSIPINTQNLGIGFHSLPLNNPLTKITNQLNEIYIELRTDAGQPFYLPNNAIVSLEFILTY